MLKLIEDIVALKKLIYGERVISFYERLLGGAFDTTITHGFVRRVPDAEPRLIAISFTWNSVPARVYATLLCGPPERDRYPIDLASRSRIVLQQREADRLSQEQ
jgi:hypothetical protein